MQVRQKIILEKIEVYLIEEGIIENYFTGEKMIEPADIVQLRETNLEISEAKPYTVLVEADDLTSFSKETRELLASKEFAGITLAKALVFKSLAQRIISNFYLQINKPHIKTRLFNDRKKAIEWLKEQYLKQTAHQEMKSKTIM